MVIDERIAERRAEVRQQRRRVRLRRTLIALVVLSVVAGLVAVERSALVGLEEVTVAGTERLSDGEVRDAAGLELGRSTLRLSLGEAEQQVEDLALVRSADARRADPLTVSITVVERQPAVAVTGDGHERVVDRDGIVLLDDVGDGLPVIELSDAPPEPGADVADHAALANAHRAWRGLSGPLRSEVVRYVAADVDDLELELRTGERVRFGRADRIDEKVRALGAVLEDVGDAPVEVIDVRAPGAPVVVGP